jgi:hypothetical protein
MPQAIGGLAIGLRRATGELARRGLAWARAAQPAGPAIRPIPRRASETWRRGLPGAIAAHLARAALAKPQQPIVWAKAEQAQHHERAPRSRDDLAAVAARCVRARDFPWPLHHSPFFLSLSLIVCLDGATK